VARLYRRSLADQGFEVLMVAVFDIAAHALAMQQPLAGVTVGRSPGVRRVYRALS
jgi:hypothetical protein